MHTHQLSVELHSTIFSPVINVRQTDYNLEITGVLGGSGECRRLTAATGAVCKKLGPVTASLKRRGAPVPLDQPVLAPDKSQRDS